MLDMRSLILMNDLRYVAEQRAHLLVAELIIFLYLTQCHAASKLIDELRDGDAPATQYRAAT
jgi:hypothetical protein